jgi:hypothetical protein
MVKIHRNKAGHPNFLHLSEMLHHIEDGVVHAYDWLAWPSMSEKERMEHKLADTELIRRIGPLGF